MYIIHYSETIGKKNCARLFNLRFSVGSVGYVGIRRSLLQENQMTVKIVQLRRAEK